MRLRYHELETGQLDVRRVDPALLEELATLFRARVGDILAWRPRSLAAKAAYYRSFPVEQASAKPARAPDTEPDRVDRLFLGGQQ